MRHYLAWFDGRPRDVSLTVRTVLLAIRSGTAWDIASRRAHEILGRPTADNASLMRCAPVALRFFADPDKRRDAALRESTLTHFDPVAGWACAAFDESLVAAMAGRLRERLPAIAAVFAQEDARVGEALLSALDAEPQEIHSSALVMDTLKTALWAVLRTHSFEDAVCTTVNLGDDADTNGAVTGALAGATYGAGSIPARWTTALLGRQHILEVADRLADAGRGRRLAVPVCRRARREIMLVPSGTPAEKAASPGSSPVVREATGKESLVAPATPRSPTSSKTAGQRHLHHDAAPRRLPTTSLP